MRPHWASCPRGGSSSEVRGSLLLGVWSPYVQQGLCGVQTKLGVPEVWGVVIPLCPESQSRPELGASTSWAGEGLGFPAAGACRGLGPQTRNSISLASCPGGALPPTGLGRCGWAWDLGARRMRVGEAWGKGIIWEVGLCAARETPPQGESFYVGQ